MKGTGVRAPLKPGARLRTAKAYPAAVYVDCPECGDGFEGGAGGSQLIGPVSNLKAGEVVTCQGCGSAFKLPRVRGIFD